MTITLMSAIMRGWRISIRMPMVVIIMIAMADVYVMRFFVFLRRLSRNTCSAAVINKEMKQLNALDMH